MDVLFRPIDSLFAWLADPTHSATRHLIAVAAFVGILSEMAGWVLPPARTLLHRLGKLAWTPLQRVLPVSVRVRLLRGRRSRPPSKTDFLLRVGEEVTKFWPQLGQKLDQMNRKLDQLSAEAEAAPLAAEERALLDALEASFALERRSLDDGEAAIRTYRQLKLPAAVPEPIDDAHAMQSVNAAAADAMQSTVAGDAAAAAPESSPTTTEPPGQTA